MPTPSNRCTAIAATGLPCKAARVPGRDVCRWHSPDPADRAKHRAESRRGGLAKAYGALPSTPALAEDAVIAALDLEQPAGLRTLLGATLKRLAQLPLDARTANAIGQLVTAQRTLIETTDFEQRLAALEAMRAPELKRIG